MGKESSQGRIEFRPAIVLSVAAALCALAFASGGFPPTAVGAATAGVWLLVVVPLLGPRGPERPGGPLTVAIAAFGLLAALTALSLQWASDDGAGFLDLVRVLGYLGALLGVGLWCRPGSGPSWLAGIGLAGVLVAAAAATTRLLGIGSPEAELIAALPAVEGRLTFPLGYWNALGYLAAAAVPVLVWIAAAAGTDGRRDGAAGDEHGRPPRARLAALAVAGIVPLGLVIYLTGSRGALLAAVAGALTTVWFSGDRRRAGLALAIGGAAAAAPVIVAAARSSVLDGTVGELTFSGAAVTAVALAAAAGGALLFAFAAAGPRRPPAALRPALALAAAAVVAVAVVVGPSALIGEFRPADGSPQADPAAALVSGSGRSEFWESAIDELVSEPLRGVGAGGYEAYWNATGDLDVPAANAHSAPLETLAELGLPGGIALAALLAAVAAGGRALTREPASRDAAGAAAGVAAAGLVAITLDWSWEMPATFAPVVLAAGLLLGRGLAGPAPEPAGERRTWAVAPLLATAAVSVWAGCVLALAAVQLERSGAALAEGDLPEAAAAARAAEQIEPWSAEPSLRLAAIEQAGGNLEAARRRGERAIRLAPDDYRGWVLLADISAARGDRELLLSYLTQARLRAPGLFTRSAAVPGLTPGVLPGAQ